jgi:isoleucyl-tRNA synthetase
MSKSKGNTVNPFDILAKYGADATRWYLVTNSPPWRPTMFDEEGVLEVQRKFFGTLVNTYAFFAMYANIDRPVWNEPAVPVAERQEIDRWILSELQSLIVRYTGYMEVYDVTKAARSISEFTIDQLSNWYVRRNRRRFWKSEMGPDKRAAYQTLYTCLDTVVKLMAPFAPFLADEIYRNLNSVTQQDPAESVHLAYLPVADAGRIDRALEERMERAQKIVVLVRAMRMKANLKVRQPLRRIILPIADEAGRAEVRKMQDIILDEINVKEIEYVHDASGIVRKKAKGNFKALGPKFGKSVQQVAARIKEMTGAEIATMEQNGSVMLTAGESAWTIVPDDVEIMREDIQGWLVETDGALMVALDTTLDEGLVAEGASRELVNRIQNMRKDAGFDIVDRITVVYAMGSVLAERLASQQRYIMSETLAEEWVSGTPAGDHCETLDLNGESITIAITRVKRG